MTKMHDIVRTTIDISGDQIVLKSLGGDGVEHVHHYDAATAIAIGSTLLEHGKALLAVQTSINSGQLIRKS